MKPRQLLTHTQHQTLVLVFALATLGLWYRPYLPTWAKPEYRPRAVSMRIPPIRITPTLPPVDLSSMTCSRRLIGSGSTSRHVDWCTYPGADLLLVTDSLGQKLPLPADRLVVFGGGPRDAAALLPNHVIRRYSNAILWIGHAPLLDGPGKVDDYLDGMQSLIAVSRAWADHVIVCTPLYYELKGPIAGKWRVRLVAGGGANSEAVARVHRELEATSDIVLVAIDNLKRYGGFPSDAWWPDGFHLTQTGRIIVAREVLKRLPPV